MMQIEMSDAARAALLSTTGQRQGAVPTSMDDFQERELRDLGLIGKGRGLTRKGTIVVQIERERDLEVTFG